MRQSTDYASPSPATRPAFFFTIDFDGTISQADVTDAVIKKFARDGWQEAELLWERGEIGSQECLARQMSLIDAPLAHVIEYAAGQPIDPTFSDFLGLLNGYGLPYAIISDGFTPIIEGIFVQAGFKDIPVYASGLNESKGGLRTTFPNGNASCLAGTCKCKTAELLARGLPIVHIGDGRSDFCLAQKADHVFCRGKLTDFCLGKEITHTPFADFSEITSVVQAVLEQHDIFLAHDRNPLSQQDGHRRALPAFQPSVP